jgi:alpha-methylacyl-CoA racemase
MALPLAGLFVLDLSRLVPGPYLTLLFADLGAEVVRVEDPESADLLRLLPPEVAGTGAGFHALNRNKKSVLLDLRTEDGRAAFRLLARRADVLVEGFRPGVLERLGLAPEALLAENPRLVVASLTGFGQTGPDRGRAGHDLTYLARAGGMGAAGEPGARVEAWPGFQAADVAGALFAAVGILAALRERDRTGRGRHVEVSLAEAALALGHLGAATNLLAGTPWGRGSGPLNGAYPCYGVYRTADGKQVALAALEPKFWLSFCAAAGREDLAGRAYEREARGELERLFAGRTRDEWAELARTGDFCLEPVWEGEEVWADPQFAARELVFEVPAPGAPGGTLRALRTPVRLGEPPAVPAPAPGAHTREVLLAAGASVELVDRLAGLGPEPGAR